MLLKAKAKRLGDTLTDMKDEALVDTLAHPTRTGERETLRHTRRYNTSGNTLVDEVVETIGDRVVNKDDERLAKVSI